MAYANKANARAVAKANPKSRVANPTKTPGKSGTRGTKVRKVR